MCPIGAADECIHALSGVALALHLAGVDLDGAPRLYIFTTCTHLIAQLKSAAVAEDGINAGEVVDPKWASAHGHAVDAARYGAMSRPSPSEEPQPSPQLEDERAEALRQWYQREREEQEAREVEEYEHSLYW